MSVAAEANLCRKFSVCVDDLFDALNEPDQGVALVTLPDADPQKLVDEYAVQLSEWKKDPDALDVAMCYGGGLTSGEFNSTIPNLVSKPFEEDFMDIIVSIETMVRNSLLPHIKGMTRIRDGHGMLRASRKTDNMKTHADVSLVTAFYGATQPGHTMILPGGEHVALSRLPSGTTLLTRQRNWAQMYPDFSLGDGVEHSVDWTGSSDTNFRAVGVQFIG